MGAPISAEVPAVIDSMAVGYVTLDRSWTITHVNAAAEPVLGRPAAELVGRNLWEMFPGARELEFGRVYRSVMETRRSEAFEAFYPGLGVWFELRVQPSGDGLAVYFLDVTAAHLAAERLTLEATRGAVLDAVGRALSGSLDVAANVGSLARLVVPYLGELSIVSLLDADGALTDVGSWHVDPDRRAELDRYTELRLAAFADDSFPVRAARTARPILLTDDAHRTIRDRMGPGPARDLLDRFAPRFAALLPMVTRGRTVGLLTVYADTAWTDEQDKLARDVVARAALAIDNSQAYEGARTARADAEAAGARLSLLARVSEALASSDDPDEAVGRLARLVVPQLGDWSVVTVIDADGNLRDVGWAHRDPAREDEVAAYAAVQSASMSEQSPVATGLRTGEPVVVPDLGDEALEAALTDPAAVALARRLDPHGVAVLPLTARGRTFGMLALVTTRGRGPHTEGEIATAQEVARRAGPVLDSARTAARALRLAESIQRSLLDVAPPPAGLEIATRYRPAYVDRQVGGDWYDAFGLPDGSTVVAIGDVMGHDVAAIAAMAQLRTLMRATAWTLRHSPAQVLAATDEASFGLGPATFATAVTAELRPAGPDGSVLMRWSNAGHPAPLLCGPDGTVTVLDDGPVDPPLGVVRGLDRHDRSTRLRPGSTVLLYTDGLIERRDRDIEAGIAELADLLARHPDDDLPATLDSLLLALTSDRSHHDDVAVLAVRVGTAPTEVFRVDLPLGPVALAVARHHVARLLQASPPEVVADTTLLVSEVVGNAVRHGRAPIGLEVRIGADTVRIGVHDSGPGRPAAPVVRPGTGATSGRGLLIVDALADRWGVDPGGAGGKTVWFELRAR